MGQYNTPEPLTAVVKENGSQPTCGGTHFFTCHALNNFPASTLKFEWTLNDISIGPGYNLTDGSLLLFNGLSESENGLYRCVVTSESGEVASDDMSLQICKLLGM